MAAIDNGIAEVIEEDAPLVPEVAHHSGLTYRFVDEPTIGDLEWVEEIHAQAQNGRLSVRITRELLSRFISEWDYPEDPADPESYKKLKASEWKEMLRRFYDWFGKSFQA